MGGKLIGLCLFAVLFSLMLPAAGLAACKVYDFTPGTPEGTYHCEDNTYPYYFHPRDNRLPYAIPGDQNRGDYPYENRKGDSNERG